MNNVYYGRMVNVEISVCIITKNEAEQLDKMLAVLAQYPFELVVVDTGSSDNSIEVARRYSESVYEYEWNNNFSDARNFSISKACNDMVLILDTDELPVDIDYNKLSDMAQNNPDKVGRIERINIFTRNKDKNINRERVNRFFDRRQFGYIGSIHEQVQRLDGELYDTYEIPVKVEHSGYDGTAEELRNKALRNIELLEQELELQENPYILYQLGKSYYMIGDYENALNYFENATTYDLEPRLEYVEDLVVSYGYTLINTKRINQALMFENLYDEFSYSCDFVFLMGLIYMNNALFEEAVRQFRKATEYSRCKMDGVNSYLAYYNIGVIYECLGYTKEALQYYRQCNEYEKALLRIKELAG